MLNLFKQSLLSTLGAYAVALALVPHPLTNLNVGHADHVADSHFVAEVPLRVSFELCLEDLLLILRFSHSVAFLS